MELLGIFSYFAQFLCSFLVTGLFVLVLLFAFWYILVMDPLMDDFLARFCFFVFGSSCILFLAWWWSMSLIPVLTGKGRWMSELKTSLIYRVSPRTVRATQRNPVTTNQNNNNYYYFKKIFSWSWFFSSTFWVLGIEPRLSGSTAGTFACWAILTALKFFLHFGNQFLCYAEGFEFDASSLSYLVMCPFLCQYHNYLFTISSILEMSHVTLRSLSHLKLPLYLRGSIRCNFSAYGHPIFPGSYAWHFRNGSPILITFICPHVWFVQCFIIFFALISRFLG